jgi:hypothetical protein
MKPILGFKSKIRKMVSRIPGTGKGDQEIGRPKIFEGKVGARLADQEPPDAPREHPVVNRRQISD